MKITGCRQFTYFCLFEDPESFINVEELSGEELLVAYEYMFGELPACGFVCDFINQMREYIKVLGEAGEEYYSERLAESIKKWQNENRRIDD